MRRRDRERLERAVESGRPTHADFDPYHDKKIYHLAKQQDGQGRVSPLCADPPRALNLKRELWTLRPEAVTCKKCLAKLAMREEPRG